MRDILDPADLWLGTPGTVFLFGNKFPVALDDTLTLLMDSGPVTVDVLANDSDPEGGSLTLISASAALGTAVAETDNTVTYTPPAGISGFDTILYTISDAEGQQRAAQVNVTISAPQLSIDTQPDNTLVVTAENGVIDITITDPAAFAGTYQTNISDLASGPIPLVAPGLTGSATPGQVLTATPGLWIYDTGAGTPAQSWQWRRAGQDIPGETSLDYTVLVGDEGQELSVREIQTDAFGQRFADSSVVGIGFLPSSDTSLLGWWDANDTATITQSGGLVSDWSDKSGGAPLQSLGSRRPQTGLRQLNAHNVIDFDGSHFMERAQTLPASGDVAFHAVIVVDATNNAFEALLSVDAVNDFQIDANNSAQFDGRLNLAGVGSPVSLSGGPFSGAMILSLIFDQSGTATAEVFISDVLRGSTSYTTPLDANTALHLMTNRSQNAWVDGAVGELVVTGTVSNRAQYHTYLANKWGIS